MNYGFSIGAIFYSISTIIALFLSKCSSELFDNISSAASLKEISLSFVKTTYLDFLIQFLLPGYLML